MAGLVSGEPVRTLYRQHRILRGTASVCLILQHIGRVQRLMTESSGWWRFTAVAAGIPKPQELPAAITTVSGLVRDAGFEPVLVGPLAKANEFAMAGPGFGQAVDAAQLRKVLKLPAARP